jgi:copper chaperone CopZ
MNRILKIEGMTCGHCSMKVKEKLLDICGVSEVEVNLEDKTATVQLEHEVSDQKFRDSIESIGYKLIGE